MAEIIVRALGERYKALGYEGDLEAFTDGNRVTSELKGYIAAATSLGIVSGYQQ